MQLTDNVFVETEFPGANVGYVTTEQGVVMIDSPQPPTQALAWRQEIEARGKISYLINTESHFDHFTGNFFFDAPVIAHDRTRKDIMTTDQNIILQRISEIDPGGVPLMEGYRIRVPSISFAERLTLYLGHHTFYLMHLPGHTLGQTGVFIPEERVVFASDNVFHKRRSFLHDADPFAWLESLKKLAALDVDHIVPGHGDVCDKSYLEEQAACIHEAIDAVQQAIERGWSKEEAVAGIPQLDHNPIVGLGTMGATLNQRGVARLYDLLVKK